MIDANPKSGIIFVVSKEHELLKGACMAKKKQKRTASNMQRGCSTMVIDSMTVWNAQKPRYNGFACGHGAHGKRGYDRNAQKRKPLDW